MCQVRTGTVSATLEPRIELSWEKHWEDWWFRCERLPVPVLVGKNWIMDSRKLGSPNPYCQPTESAQFFFFHHCLEFDTFRRPTRSLNCNHSRICKDYNAGACVGGFLVSSFLFLFFLVFSVLFLHLLVRCMRHCKMELHGGRFWEFCK